jgi:DNA-binding CsgD family transcriptional regulator
MRRAPRLRAAQGRLRIPRGRAMGMAEMAGGGTPATVFERAYASVEGAADVMGAVEAVRFHYGLDNATYHLGQLPAIAVDGPYVKSTYPPAWLTRYLLQGYTRVDPVVIEGFARTLPFDWRDLTMTQKAEALFADFVAHGLSAYGYSVPVLDRNGRRALFSVNAAMEETAWDAFVAAHRSGWSEIAHALHRKAMAEIFGEGIEIPRLTPREMEALILTADGKTAKEIGRILDISDRTVEAYLLSARHKLGAENTVKAIAKAVKLRIINI